MHINLLPWRKQKAQSELRNMIVLSTCILIIVTTATTLLHFKIMQGIIELQSHYQSLKKHTPVIINKQTLSQAIHRYRQLNTQLTWIHNKKQQQKQLMAALIQLAKAMPSSLRLVTLSKKDQELTVQGFADNPQVATQYSKNLAHQPELSAAVLKNINDEKRSRAQHNGANLNNAASFIISLNIKPRKED